MASLQRALELAVQYHGGQFDDCGQAYILHPIRVMLGCQNDIERQVAIMHDLVEDTDVTLDMLLQEGFSEDVIECIDCLTRRRGEDYGDFIERCCQNQMAIKIKLLDIKDNMDLTRVAYAPNNTPDSGLLNRALKRNRKYLTAHQRLIQAQVR